MLLEQAIYTSMESSRGRGYHLVSRSAGIDNDWATQLNRWCPSHASLLKSDNNASSLNFHQLNRDHFVLSRTTHGGPEFSQRGGLQVVTLILILRRDQLIGYSNNPFAVARTARSLGHLRWDNRYPALLPKIELPDTASSEQIIPPKLYRFPMLDQLESLLLSEEQVAIVTENQGLGAIEAILTQLQPSKRCSLSFTSGLKPSRHRPFRIHVIPYVDMQTRLKLSSLHIHCLPAG